MLVDPVKHYFYIWLIHVTNTSKTLAAMQGLRPLFLLRSRLAPKQTLEDFEELLFLSKKTPNYPYLFDYYRNKSYICNGGTGILQGKRSSSTSVSCWV